MQAWQVHENGEPGEVMRLEDVERPTPGDGQVLLRVRAANINFPDVLMCRGHYQVRPPLPFTPGVEICGETEDGRRPFSDETVPLMRTRLGAETDPAVVRWIVSALGYHGGHEALPEWAFIHTHFGFGYRFSPEPSFTSFSQRDHSSVTGSSPQP